MLKSEEEKKQEIFEYGRSDDEEFNFSSVGTRSGYKGKILISNSQA